MSARYLDEKDDPFWSEEPSILFSRNRLIEFVPTSDMSWKERLNALTRLFSYASILLAMYLGRSWPLYIALVGVLMSLFLFRFGPKPAPEITENPTGIATIFSPNPYIPENQPKCIKSTRDNPFGNVLLNEYTDNPTRPPACPADTPEEKAEIEKNWSFNLYRDIDDAIWDRNNGQRQWVTNPSTTIPNDQGAFVNWLYRTGPSCKTDQTACLRYETLQANRSVVGDSEYLQ